MVDPDAATKDALYEEAVRTFTEHYAGDAAARARTPDRNLSRFTLTKDPTVVLMDTKGVPLGTVTWADGRPSFEPPTKITVVDHFQGFRPAKR
jgi:hypothetical protein